MTHQRAGGIKGAIWQGVRAGLAFALLAAATAAWGQSPTAPPSIENRPKVVPPPSASERPGLPPRPERPKAPGQPPPAGGMQELVRDFQAARQAFIKQQQELNRKMAGATEEQRAAIREQLKERLQQWRDLQRQQVQEMRDQAREIKNINLRDVIDSGSGEGRGR